MVIQSLKKICQWETCSGSVLIWILILSYCLGPTIIRTVLAGSRESMFGNDWKPHFASANITAFASVSGFGSPFSVSAGEAITENSPHPQILVMTGLLKGFFCISADPYRGSTNSISLDEIGRTCLRIGHPPEPSVRFQAKAPSWGPCHFQAQKESQKRRLLLGLWSTSRIVLFGVL